MQRLPSGIRKDLQGCLCSPEYSLVTTGMVNDRLYSVLATCGAASSLKKLLGNDLSARDVAVYGLYAAIAWPQIRRWIGRANLLRNWDCSMAVAECVGLDDVELVETLFLFQNVRFETCRVLLSYGSPDLIRETWRLFNEGFKDMAGREVIGTLVGSTRDLALVTIPDDFCIDNAIRYACTSTNIETLKYLLGQVQFVIPSHYFTWVMNSLNRYSRIYAAEVIDVMQLLVQHGAVPDPADEKCFQLALYHDSPELLDYMLANGFYINMNIVTAPLDCANSVRWCNDHKSK